VSPIHLAGTEVVIHCAAAVDEWAPPGVFAESNIAGTKRLLEAARAAGVRRLIHISTDSVIFTGRHLRGVDEEFPIPTTIPYEYGATKAVAEQLVLGANAPGVFETLALRPILIWGAGDTTVLPAVKTMHEKGGFVWLGGGRNRISTTHVDNLVHAIELAITSPASGEAVFVTDESPTRFRDFLTRYAAADGIALGGRSLPVVPVRAAAAIVEAIWKVVRPRSRPPLTRYAVASLSTDYWVESDKARRLLGYVPAVTLDAGLAALERERSLRELSQ
jgi:nucleoside-diphosphate-sugar epimerase